MITFAIGSAICVPRNTILSLSKREYISKALSPRGLVSITIGTMFCGVTMLLLGTTSDESYGLFNIFIYTPYFSSCVSLLGSVSSSVGSFTELLSFELSSFSSAVIP